MTYKENVTGATKEELAWAAGYIDGEGCINIGQNNPTSHVVRLTIDSTDKRPLLKLQSLFGGRVNAPYDYSGRYKDNYQRKPQWVWSLCGTELQPVLRGVRLYLIVKGEQADIAISFPIQKKRGRGVKTPPEVWKQRIEMKEQLHNLKR